MNANLDWLRPHFERVYVGEKWETTKLAYRLYPQLVTLTAPQVGQALLNLVGQESDVAMRPMDFLYRTYPKEIWEQIIKDDQTQRAMPWPDWMDCDDYAWQFKAAANSWYHANAVAFILDQSAGHAYNAIVFADGTASLFEPQKDKFVAKGDPTNLPVGPGGSGRYSLTSGLILV